MPWDNEPPEDRAVHDAMVALAEVLWAVKDDEHRHFLVLGAVGCVLETFIPGMRAMRVRQAERESRKAWTH
jgi:hypothetical protein